MPSTNQSLVTLGASSVIALAAAVGYYYYFYSKKASHSKEPSKEPSASSSNNTHQSIPVIDLNAFFGKNENPEKFMEECKKAADAFHRYGLVCVRDPRVSEADNDRFLNQMERYFEQSDGKTDARPQYSYQVGVTSELIEKPRDHGKLIASFEETNKPWSSSKPSYDPKWRFFWRIGPVPEKTDFPVQNMEPVIPPGFPQWKETMDMWGNKMLNAVFLLAEMSAVGFGMPKSTFTDMMHCGPHLLAPTGSDFRKYNAEGTVLAGFHYDLNFFTIHGKSRFPGLFVWTREGVKTPVAVPDGCLLVQAGKQVEYLTGGYVMAGFHEVVITSKTKSVIEARKAKGESLWRVSSTLFSHIQSDQVLQPLAPFDTAEAKEKYHAVKAGNMVQKELEAISLARS
jgi:isopenicillin N synthase-like dioxygenase